MGKEELIRIDPSQIERVLAADEILHIFKVLDGLLIYDCDKRREGKVGCHAELKSGRCSDGFLNSKKVLRYPNVCRLFAQQLALRFQILGTDWPDYATGIPDGATLLGLEFARALNIYSAKMVKEYGVIKLATPMPRGVSLLLVEDFCTKGTGFREAVLEIHKNSPGVKIFPWEMVIINRGELEVISVDPVGDFTIAALAIHRIQDWDQDECPLCHPEMDRGLPKGHKIPPSPRIKPKATSENWEKIITSQL